MASNETIENVNEVIKEAQEVAEATEIKVDVAVDKKKAEEAIKTLKETFSGLSKTIDVISGGIKKAMETLANSVKSALGTVSSWVTDAFTITSLEEYEAAAERFGEGLAGALFSINENMGALETSVVDAVAPLANVVVPIINDAILALTGLADGMGQVVGALFSSAAGTDALAQSADTAAGSAENAVAILPATVEDSLSPQLQEIVDKIQGLITPLQTIDLSPIVTSFSGLQTALTPLTQDLFAGLEWAYLNLFVPLAQWTTEGLLPGFLDLIGASMGVLHEVLVALEPLGIWLWESFLLPIAEWTGGALVDSLPWLTDMLNSISSWISENQATIEVLAVIIGSVAAAIVLVNVALEIASVIGAAATVVSYGFGTAMKTINWPIVGITAAITALIAIVVLLVKNWDEVSAAAAQVWGFVKQKFEEFNAFLQNIFAKDWTETFGAFGHILNGFFANVENIWNAVKTIFEGIVGFVKNVFAGNWEGAWESIKQIISGVWDGIVAAVKTPINSIIGFINGMVSGVVSGVNGIIRVLNRLSFTIPDWVPGFGGSTFGFNIQQLTAPQIPYLAKGAVLPANRPFLAVVGDQRHGTNVEAPLTTIQEAVAVVMQEHISAMMAGFQALLDEQRATRHTIEGIEIGDSVIGQAAARYNSKMAIVRGV